MAALAFMKVTREEYEPRSTGEVSLSLLLTLIMSKGRPKTSATDCATTVSDPCPISAAPVCTVTPPSMSILRWTVAWGNLFGSQWMGNPLPEMKKPQPTPIPLPRGILRNFSSHPEAFRTFSRHSLMPMLVTLKPVIVALCGGRRLANLKSIGSTSSCSQMSSKPTSTAHLELTAPWPLIAPLAGLFVHTLAPV